jgi:hypothetical protein
MSDEKKPYQVRYAAGFEPGGKHVYGTPFPRSREVVNVPIYSAPLPPEERPLGADDAPRIGQEVERVPVWNPLSPYHQLVSDLTAWCDVYQRMAEVYPKGSKEWEACQHYANAFAVVLSMLGAREKDFEGKATWRSDEPTR